MRRQILPFFVLTIVLISGCLGPVKPTVNVECNLDNNVIYTKGTTFFHVTVNNQEPLKQDVAISFIKNPNIKVVKNDGSEKQKDVIVVAPNSRAQEVYTIGGSLDGGTTSAQYTLQADAYIGAQLIDSCVRSITIRQ